jgi:NADH-quinone oxidoreductase subunit A
MTTILASNGFNGYAALGVLILMAVVFGAGNLVLTHLLGPSRDGKVKGTVYESGMNPLASVKRRFNIRFYMVAMTFLLFDVEIVFLYPWASVFPNLGEQAHAEHGVWMLGRIAFFVATSVIGFVYAWRKGTFRYD